MRYYTFMGKEYDARDFDAWLRGTHGATWFDWCLMTHRLQVKLFEEFEQACIDMAEEIV